MARIKSGIDLYKAASSIEKKAPKEAAQLSPDKKVPPEKPNPHSEGFLKLTGGEDSKPGKAARLLLLLGKDEAAEVMGHLSPQEAEEVAKHIASTQRVDMAEAKEILNEFGDRFADIEIHRARGGVDAAKEILKAAFGVEKANAIVAKAIPEAAPRPFAFLNDLEFTQLAGLLRKESPMTLSLVMGYIKPEVASRLLESLPDDQKSPLILRMARSESISRDILATVEVTLQDKIRLLGKENGEELDGRSALADILRFMDVSDERRLLDELQEADPSLAEQVKQKLYTMDTIFHLRNQDLQEVLRSMSEKDIALLLKGQTPEINERINSSLSSRRRLLVADEGDLMGVVRRSDADAAVKEFLEKLRAGEEAGTYLIIREDADLID